MLPVGIIIMALTNPPDSLQAHELLLAQAAPDLVRIGDTKYPNPVHWSKLGYNRFDSPEAPYGIFYTAEDFEAALIEVFGDDWVTTVWNIQSSIPSWTNMALPRFERHISSQSTTRIEPKSRNGAGGTRSRLIRVSTSAGHVRCTPSDGGCTPARSA